MRWRAALAVLFAGAVALVCALEDGGGVVFVAGASLLAAATPLYRPDRRIGCGVLVAGCVLCVAGGGLDNGSAFLMIPNAWMVGRYTDGRLRIAVGLVMVAASQLRIPDGESAPNGFFVVFPFGGGWALAERYVLARKLEQRGAELDAEREVYAELSVRYERARLAAELHDIVAHAISVMVVQASAGQRLAAVDDARTAETFAAIGEAARHAEADMSRLVVLLSDPEPAVEDPDLTIIHELIDRAAGTGLDITLRLEGDRASLTPELCRSAYLVVREGLTNALRYAAGAPVNVLVDGRRDELVVQVANGAATSDSGSLAGHGSGRGLPGLRERLDAVGGRLDAGPTGDGGWSLRAALPRHLN